MHSKCFSKTRIFIFASAASNIGALQGTVQDLMFEILTQWERQQLNKWSDILS